MTVHLHSKYGVNPTISTCIICGKEKNEILFLGSAYKDKAPMHMVTSIEPCDDCKEKYLKTGVLLIESDDGKVPSTGSCVVVKTDAYNKMFGVEGLPLHNIAFIKTGILKEIGVIQ